MKPPALLTLLLILIAMPAAGQPACLEPDALIKMDGQWEQALLKSDAEALAKMLADEFVWVHNHAGTIDDRAKLLKRAADPSRRATGATKARRSSNVEARVVGNAGVVTGFTLVDRGPTPTRYSFMRTYVAHDGQCLLLANQTMAVPEE